MKKTTRGVLIGSISIVLIGAVVGGLAMLTRGFKSWDPKEWGGNAKDVVNDIGKAFEDPKKIDVDLTSEKDVGKVAKAEDLLSILNTNQKIKVFKGVNTFTEVYQEKGGLRLSSDTVQGGFDVALENGYTFKSIDVTALNYSTVDETDKEHLVYTSDVSSINVNDNDITVKLSNDSKTNAPIEKKQTFTFTDGQDHVKINAVEKRLVLTHLTFTVQKAVEETTTK